MTESTKPTMVKRDVSDVAMKKKSTELIEAEQSVADDVDLTAAEKMEIEAVAESEAEAVRMTQEAVAEKTQRAAMRQAKTTINPTVPSQHLVNRPTYGHITATVDYHMRETYSFLLGRNVDNKHNISGLFEAAAASRRVVQGHVAGCPYATWTLIQLDEQIALIRSLVKDAEREAQALINHSTTISIAPFTSKRPALVDLDFRVAYGFHFADLLTHYDHILRMVKSYELQFFITHAEFSAIEQKLGSPLRRLFRIPTLWNFVGKDAVNQKTATFLAAEHRMGILPDGYVEGQFKPRYV